MVGDPIYNAADARLGRSSLLNTGLAGQLNRLPGSGREVQACAREGGGAQVTVLEGGTAKHLCRTIPGIGDCTGAPRG